MKFILLKDYIIDGPIPLGPWTELFQNLGYEANGEIIEFPWRGQNILVINENGDNLWEWNVFNYFNIYLIDAYNNSNVRLWREA